MPEKLIAASLFLIVYLFLVTDKGRPILMVFAGVIVLLALGIMTPLEALGSINLNVIGILLGTMVLSELFVRSNVPAYLASLAVMRSRTVRGSILWVCLLSGAVSAAVDNVATVLMIAPVAFEIAKRLQVSPVPFMIGIAASSNLQGAATLIGDATSIVLAAEAKMNFLNFFWMEGRPGIFFSVQIGAVASFLVLYFAFRGMKGRVFGVTGVKVKTWIPSLLMILMMVTMALSSLFPGAPSWILGATALFYGLLGILWNSFNGGEKLNYKDMDWNAVFLLTGLFMLIGSLTVTGIVTDIASFISGQTKGNTFLAYSVIVWFSVLVSAFVDNIPYTVAMLPVARLVAQSAGASPNLMMFGLLLGTTLGGNITPIGASANICAMSLLKKNGHDVSFGDYAKIGIPFTIAAAVSGSLLNWFLWR